MSLRRSWEVSSDRGVAATAAALAARTTSSLTGETTRALNPSMASSGPPSSRFEWWLSLGHGINVFPWLHRRVEGAAMHASTPAGWASSVGALVRQFPHWPHEVTGVLERVVLDLGPGRAFNGPRGLAVTADGALLLVADQGNSRICVLDAHTGEWVRALTGPAGSLHRPRSVAIAASTGEVRPRVHAPRH